MVLASETVSTFHPNGELATRGHYVDGKLDGTFARFVAKSGEGEPLRTCCVPPGASEMRAEYRSGQLLSETFFDSAGRPLCDDGTPWPARPPGVPEVGVFDELSGRYYERIAAESNACLRYFDQDGHRVEEVDWQSGRAVARRSFAADGTCTEDCGLDERGAHHGPSRRRFGDAQSPYADPLFREEFAHFEHGEASGEVRLCGHDGALLRTLSRGAPLANGTSPVVLGTEAEHATATELFELADRLCAEQRTREAVAVAARAVGRDGDLARFASFLTREVAALRPDVASERALAAATSKDSSPSRLLDTLLAGADPVALLQTLAASIPPESPAALDYANAVLRLRPDHAMAHIVRALVRLERGDREGALADADAVARDSASAADSLRESCRCVFPAFSFQPAEQALEASSDELLAIGVEQPLAAVQRAIRLYATRLAEVRAGIVAKVGEQAWLPPDTRQLLAGGPVALERYTARIDDEDENGAVEVTEVAVDETLPSDERSVRRLMVVARADWAALTWLCWSVGLDRVAIPDEVRVRALFAEAANQATLRCFWAHDRLRTEGFVALARQVPTFTWEGLPIETMPRLACEIAAAEYLEIRAQFLWLLFPENVSPFQADLRKV